MTETGPGGVFRCPYCDAFAVFGAMAEWVCGTYSDSGKDHRTEKCRENEKKEGKSANE